MRRTVLSLGFDDSNIARGQGGTRKIIPTTFVRNAHRNGYEMDAR